MSHTPGPWWYDDKTSTIRGSLPAYWEDPDDKTADKAPIFALHGACSGEDIPANVRLTCAAPDLLEALRELLAVSPYDSTLPEVRPAVDKSIAALRKAIG